MSAFDHIVQSLVSSLTEGIKNSIGDCNIPGCKKKRVGVTCRACRRHLCVGHAYVKLSLTSGRPAAEVVCASCVIDAHPELLE